MSSLFHPRLLNDPFGDPGLYVEFMYEKRALLFDLGDLSELSTRKLLRISDVFVSHMHMDHFCGLDRLVRLFLGRERTLRLYGPEGLIDAVGHKLAAYTWNLVENYDTDFTLVVSELLPQDGLRIVEFRCRSAFRPEAERSSARDDDWLLQEDRFTVTTAVLDHGIPCLAFALEERARVNIWKNRLQGLGLGVGPWLRDLKAAILRGDPDDTPIRVGGTGADDRAPDALPLGRLREQVTTLTEGAKIAYVADVAWTEANLEKILPLVRGATTLYIESAFLDEDAARACARHHLTARQAGEIAGRAGVKRLVTFHYSPRYEGRGDALAREAAGAFRAAGGREG